MERPVRRRGRCATATATGSGTTGGAVLTPGGTSPWCRGIPHSGTRTSQLAIHGASGAEPGQAAASISLTPFLYEVFDQRNQDLAALRRLYLKERNQLLDALREADGKRQQLLVEQAAAQERLEQLSQPLTEEESARVTYGELKAGHPEELTRMRRARAPVSRPARARNGCWTTSMASSTRRRWRRVRLQGAIATKLAESPAARRGDRLLLRTAQGQLPWRAGAHAPAKR